MKQYKVIASETTARQLENRVMFIAKNSPAAAEALRQRLIEGMRSL